MIGLGKRGFNQIRYDLEENSFDPEQKKGSLG